MNLSFIWLNIIFNNNYSLILNLLGKIKKLEEIMDLSTQKWKELNIAEDYLQKIEDTKFKNLAKSIIEFCKKENIKIVNIFDINYPYNLINITNPPTILYYRGELYNSEPSISVVGSRNYTEYGKLSTEKIVTDLADNNVLIVSGMARGIDTIAHEIAIKNNSKTFAILGCGVNVIYPKFNETLYNKICLNGAVISEFLPNTKPYSWNFPTRNRLISGISNGTLIIEANIESGTMTTANWACEQGKNLYCVPGNIFSAQSKGTNKLISEGAKIVTSSSDILEDLFGISKVISKKAELPKLDSKEQLIFENILASPISIYEICLKSCLPINEVNSILTLLELNGYIKKLAGNNFIRDFKYINL